MRETLGALAPWELEYKLVRTERDEADDMVSFVGGAITDADGKPLWRARCAATRRVIERGAEGGGVPRGCRWSATRLSPSAGVRAFARLRAAPMAAPLRRVPPAEALLVGKEGGAGAHLRDRFVARRRCPSSRLGIRIKTPA